MPEAYVSASTSALHTEADKTASTEWLPPEADRVAYTEKLCPLPNFAEVVCYLPIWFVDIVLTPDFADIIISTPPGFYLSASCLQE